MVFHWQYHAQLVQTLMYALEKLSQRALLNVQKNFCLQVR
jgi:hypothetical protein